MRAKIFALAAPANRVVSLIEIAQQIGNDGSPGLCSLVSDEFSHRRGYEAGYTLNLYVRLRFLIDQESVVTTPDRTVLAASRDSYQTSSDWSCRLAIPRGIPFHYYRS